LSAIVLGLAPVFAIIVLGYALRRRRLVADAFWPAAEHLTFFVFFPALLLTNTWRADFAALAAAGMVAAVVAAIGSVAAVALGLGRLCRFDGPSLSTLVQGAIRPNVYVAIATAVALRGERGLATVSLCVAVAVPLVNLISVAALVRFAAAGAERPSAGRVAATIARNPLILACLAGLALNALAVPPPVVVTPTLELLGRASLPIGLLCVGAGLDPAALRGAGRLVLAASVLKLALLPAVTWFACAALGVGEEPRLIATVFASLPISASAYVMARQMGGNAPALAAAITATTIAAAVTMPVVAFLLIRP
jgi:hypothetical protein